jgi:hypothetical protein
MFTALFFGAELAYKRMNTHAFLKLDFISGHGELPQPA